MDLKGIATTILFMAAILLAAGHASAFPLDASDSTIQSALDYLASVQQDNGGFGDSSPAYADLTPLAVMAIKAANQDPNAWTKNGSSPIDFLKTYSIPALNSSSIPTQYSVVIMALIAAGENAEDIVGRNLVNELASKELADGSFDTNAWITDQEWAILALVDAGYKDSDDVANAVAYLKTQQLADGGFGAWCFDESSSCPDETALGIMALLAAGTDSNSNAIKNAETRLRQFQIANGGFDPGWGENIDTDSWATAAMFALGNNHDINTSADSFSTDLQASYSITLSITNTNNGSYPSDRIKSFQNSTTGGFEYFKPVQDTSYAIMALLGKPFPIDRANRFSISLNQTENWNYDISGSNKVNSGETSDLIFNFALPGDSAGKQNTVSITVTALLNSLVKTKNIILSVNAQSTPPKKDDVVNTGGSSGGGGGGLGASQAATFFDAVIAGQTITLDVPSTKDLSVIEVEIIIKAAANSVRLLAEKFDSRPSQISSAPDGVAYKFAEIKAENLPADAISSASIKFKVSKKWISENSIDASTVVLQRYASGGWQELPTTKISEDETSIFYSAASQGLSYFAITGEAAAKTVELPASETNTITALPASQETSGGATNEITGAAVGMQKDGISAGVFLKLAALALLIVLMAVRLTRKMLVRLLIKKPLRFIFGIKPKPKLPAQ